MSYKNEEITKFMLGIDRLSCYNRGKTDVQKRYRRGTTEIHERYNRDT